MKNLFVKTCEQKPQANSLQRDADFLSAPEKVLTHFCVCVISHMHAYSVLLYSSRNYVACMCPIRSHALLSSTNKS